MATKGREIPWNQIHPWLKAAHDFAVQNQGWFAVKVGSKEYAAWAKYFKNLGWYPRAFLTLSSAATDGATREWTAPCQWPEWFTIEVANVGHH